MMLCVADVKDNKDKTSMRTLHQPHFWAAQAFIKLRRRAPIYADSYARHENDHSKARIENLPTLQIVAYRLRETSPALQELSAPYSRLKS